MIRRSLRIVVCSLVGVAAVLIVALAILAWRLSLGPVSLALLAPTLEQLVEGFHKPFEVAVGDIVLTWAGWNRGLDVRLMDVRVSSPDGAPTLRAPELAVSLSAEALLHGRIAPATIELTRPSVQLVRLPDGRLRANLAGQEPGSEGWLDRVLEGVQGTANSNDSMSHLKRVGILGGDLILEDQRLGARWQATVREAHAWRTDSGLEGQAVLALADGREQAEITVFGAYDREHDRWDATVRFDGLRPAAFAHARPSLRVLEAIDAPLQGQITVCVTGRGTIESLAGDLSGGEGYLALPVPLAQDLGVLSAAQRRRIQSLALKADYRAADDRIEINNIAIAFKAGETVYVPAPIDHAFPMTEARGRGRFLTNGRRIEVEDANLDLDGPKLRVRGAVDDLGRAPSGTVEATVLHLNTNTFKRYWPPTLATGAYDWVVEHLSEGGIPEARMRATFGSGGDGNRAVSLAGSMDIRGVTVNYRPPMPRIYGASGTATFDDKTLTIRVTSGHTDGLAIREGTIRFPDLATDVPPIDIDLVIDGTARGALELLSHPPLGYTKAVGIDPAATGGNVSVRVNLKFPLLKNLPFERIGLSASADIDKLSIAGAVLGADVTNGNLKLTVDENGMNVAGRVALAGVSGDLTWRENFAKSAPFQRRLRFDAIDVDLARIKELGAGAMPPIETWVHGTLGATLRLVEFRDADSLFEGRIDATKARIAFPYLGWNKEPGAAATGEIVARLRGGRLTDITRFSVSAKDLAMVGSAAVANGATSVDIQRLAHGRTDIQAMLTLLPDGGWNAFVGGTGLDLGPLMKVRPSDRPSGRLDPTFTLAADVDNVWFERDQPIQKLMGTVVRQNGVWTLVQAQGMIGDESPVDITIQPAAGQTRDFRIETRDAGAVLRALGIFPDMIGGRLKMNGVFDDSQPGQPLSGRLTVENYRILNAPFLARLLNVMALTGILEALRGPGIAFSTLSVPFTLGSGVLKLKDAEAYGTSLGVTASGDVDTITDTVDIEGTVVPFYLINAALGRLPLIGDLFTGGEKGSGLFAATYRMTGPLNDPKVSVNPVSVLAPSFLRRLLDLFDGAPGSEAPAAPRP